MEIKKIYNATGIGIIYISILIFCSCSTNETTEIPDHVQAKENVKVYPAGEEPLYQIRFEPDVSYGSTEDLFILVGGSKDNLMRVDARGRVFIPDRQQNIIHVFDSDGTYLTHMGNKGRGPGEFELIGDISINSDYLYVFDSNLLRINIFTLDSLEFSHTVNFDDSWSHIEELENYSKTDQMYVREDGTFLVKFSSRPIPLPFDKPEKMDNPELNRFRYSLADQKGEEFSEPIFEHRNRRLIFSSFQGINIALELPVHGKPLLDITSEGHLITAWSEDFFIEIHSPEGEYLHGFYHPFNRFALQREDLLKQYEQNKNLPNYKVSQTMELPEAWPALYSIKVDDEDRIWVATIIEDLEKFEWWVLEKSGQLLAKFTWPRDKIITDIRNNFMYLQKEDSESGERRIERHQIIMN